MAALRRTPVRAAPADTDQRLDAIGAMTRHDFADPGLVIEALTHGSAGGRRGPGRRDNERLEFLGDRVLGLGVATLLMAAFPDEPEGALTPRHAALVSEPALAAVARDLGLGDWITAAPSEPLGNDTRPAILADALEALIGALYLDAGFQAAFTFIETHFRDRLDAMTSPPQDPKSRLQEWTQARGLGLPIYELLHRDGPAHAPTFEVQVAVPNHAPARGSAGSKRLAEREAASAFFTALDGEGAGT